MIDAPPIEDPEVPLYTSPGSICHPQDSDYRICCCHCETPMTRQSGGGRTEPCEEWWSCPNDDCESNELPI